MSARAATTSMHRVLMTTDTVGGVWTYAIDLARGLAVRGTEVVLATMGAPPSDAQREAARAVPGLRLFESTYRLEWMDDPWEDVDAAGTWLLDIERHVDPDVVHLNGYTHGNLPWRRPTVIVGHSCVVSWWHAVHAVEPPRRYGEYRARVQAGLSAVDRVVCPTRWMADALVKHYGPLARPLVIPNGTWPERWRPGHKAPFVFAAGRLWDPAKNLRTLTRAAASVRWPVRVAGDSTSPDGRRLDPEGVEWLGRLAPEDVAQQMSEATVFAHPARYEPFGLAPLEAASSGCALVLGDIPSLREVWGHGAIYVEPDDPAALAAALNDLADHPGWCQDLARRARRRAARYGVHGQVEAYLRLYETLTRYARRSTDEPRRPEVH